MEQFIKLRKQLDAYSQLVGEMTPIKNIGVSADINDFNSEKKTFEIVGFPEYTISEELKRCVNNLLLAKAWTGKILGYLQQPPPYNNDGQRSEVSHIENVDAKADIEPWKIRNDWSNKTHITKVDTIRQLVNDCISVIQNIMSIEGVELKDARSCSIARTEVETNLIEARFQLGFELGRIKQEKSNPSIDYNTPMYGGVKQK